jgi:hypothetical protein
MAATPSDGHTDGGETMGVAFVNPALVPGSLLAGEPERERQASNLGAVPGRT